MKIILVGHPGSQKIVPASKYLTGKYLPMFEPIYLNYKGGINGWSEYLSNFLKYFTDDFLILALDDYLIADHIDLDAYFYAEDEIQRRDAVCTKLCQCTEQEHEEYPCTTQYTIWNRKELIFILDRIKTPWEFEINGSAIFKGNPRWESLHRPCLTYFANSCLSSRWEGVKLDGLKEEDINYLKTNGFI